MEQEKLVLRESQREIADEIILTQPDFKAALKLCKQVSGLTDDQIARELDIDPAHWSRIWSDNAHFPDNKMVDFMAFCQNIIPVRWLALKHGYALVRVKSALEAENEALKKQIEKQEIELEAIRKFVHGDSK